MKTKRILISAFLLMLTSTIIFAHPGSGIVVDKSGQVYFMDTGKGVWKIDLQGKLTYLPSSRFHWMVIDNGGNFSNEQKNFGGFFERVTPQGVKPAIIICPEFPFTIGSDGNIYYADTRSTHSKIVRRTPDGKETTIAAEKAFTAIHGIAAGMDGALYVTEASNPDANTIRQVNMNGSVSIIATYTGKNTRDTPLGENASYCRGLSIDSLGNIYVAATGSRSILKVTPKGGVTTVLSVSSPWTPTAVTLFKGEIYVQEWHDVTADKLEVREAWIPRVRKVGVGGKVTTLATVSRN
jgi:sugar lactone lactonase YvrE